MTRVLLTGASGFIGRYAAPLLLDHGHELHAISHRPVPDGARPREIVWHHVDLRDAAATAEVLKDVRPSHLLHLAWDVEPGRFWTSVENVRWVEASLAMMRAFLAAGGERAVLAGTCAEYDWTGDAGGLPALREDESPIAPATLYGACKHATHLVAEKLAAQFDAQLAWGRVFYLYGPHEQPSRLVPAIAASLLAGRPTPTTDGLQRRDFMHVADVAAGFVALLESNVDGAVNLATGEAVEVRAIVSAIAAQTGNQELLEWGAIARAPSDPDVIVGHTGRLDGEVGFTPAVKLAAGLAETVGWWRRQAAGGNGSAE